MESDFAQGFVNSMLGWMRSLAAAVANIFKTTSGSQSGGSPVLLWFEANWVWLLVTLIVLGVLTDWIVWLLRWRPHWLWFRKHRMVVDNDDDTMERTDAYYEPKERFHSRALRYADEYEYADDEDYADEDDAYSKYVREIDDEFGDDDEQSEEYDDEEQYDDEQYDDEFDDEYDDEQYDEPQDDYDDVLDGEIIDAPEPKQVKTKSKGLFEEDDLDDTKVFVRRMDRKPAATADNAPRENPAEDDKGTSEETLDDVSDDNPDAPVSRKVRRRDKRREQ